VADQTVSKKLHGAFVQGVEEVWLDIKHAVYSNSADNKLFHISFVIVHIFGHSLKLAVTNQEYHDM
jgi:hypothetical protein